MCFMQYTYTVVSDDLSEIKAVMRGPEYLSCLHDLYQELRAKAKYIDKQDTTWQAAYDLFLRVIADHAVDPIEE